VKAPRVETSQHIPERLKPQSLIEATRLGVSDQEDPPDRQADQEFIHESGAYSLSLVVGMDHDIVNGRVVFEITKSARSSDEASAVEGETHGGAVLEGPPDFLALSSSKIGEFE